MEPIAKWANKEILTIWEKYCGQPECKINQVPLLFHELKKNSLLFIGINPSSSERGLLKIERKTNRVSGTTEPLLIWKDKESVAIDELAELQRDACEHYDYFSKFRHMAQKLETEWSHIDLFFYRMRSQETFRKIIFNKGQLTDFAKDQLQLAARMIEAIEPRAIVVANALACDIMKREFSSLQGELDQNSGCHYYQGTNGKRFPTFFTSMLTGQRALDRGSLDRLVWQVGRILTGFAASPTS